MNKFDKLAEDMTERKYNLRIEFNHSTMKWYAYYAGREMRSLFDYEYDWLTAADTPTEALIHLEETLPIWSY